jgi:hypothetical protein
VDEENDRAILDGGSIDLAGVDVEGEHDVAEVLVGRPLKGRCGAGAGSLAGAVLEIGSAQRPAHRSSSLWLGPSSTLELMPVNHAQPDELNVDQRTAPFTNAALDAKR